MKAKELRGGVWIGEPSQERLAEVSQLADLYWPDFAERFDEGAAFDPVPGQIAISVAATLLVRTLQAVPMPQDRAQVTTGVLTFIQELIQKGVNAQVAAAPGLHKRPPLIVPGKPG